ncbi:MAG: acyltransferase [Bacteroidota bacterium]
MISNKDNYFPSLTGFRAIAAWLVFANHYNLFAADRFPFLNALVDELGIGVSMFFVLSGFLITIRYDDPLLPKPTFSQYMRNRFARIYPLYFLLTTITFIVTGGWGWVYVANITFIKGFVDELKFTGIAQGWSLTVEETFYLLAPLIFIMIRRSRLMTWLLPFIFLMIGYIIFDSLHFMLVYTFFGRCFEFFIGIALAKIFQGNKTAINNRQLFTWIGIVGILVFLLVLVYTRDEMPELLIRQLLVPAATALLLWGLLTERSWIRKLLSTNVMQLLGKSSYAFYLIHIGVLAVWLSDNVTWNPVVLFVILNVIAIGIYYLIERPLRKVLLTESAENTEG